MKNFWIHISLLLIFSFFNSPAIAQINKTFHQTFELDENINLVKTDILGEVKLESWAGIQILIETKVLLEGATQEILDHLVEKGRYEIVSNDMDLENAIEIKTKYPDRRIIKYKDKECFEQVRVKIYYPEEFNVFEKNKLIKTKE